jgi:predicted lipoprotein with Yx(FWY)xxD motif
MHRHCRQLTLAAVITAAALFAAACGEGATDRARVSASSAPAPESTPTTPSSSPAAAGIAITTADSDYGPMVFDAHGQAIYLFDKETAGRPDCHGECAAAWPPVLTDGIPQATGAVRPDLLGTVPRDDGSTQVTYAGHPLYYYAHEEPGQVLCHDVMDFGGRWLVVTPEGTPAP